MTALNVPNVHVMYSYISGAFVVAIDDLHEWTYLKDTHGHTRLYKTRASARKAASRYRRGVKN